MSTIKISKPTSTINGTIKLDGSKSISNRVQIIRALCHDDFDIIGLSTSDDSKCLHALLADLSQDQYDAHHAGTTYRFMTAFLSMRPGTQVLTGSDRMKERPIGKLVDALRILGADIHYMEKEGYPPLKIGSPSNQKQQEVTIDASISSQYLSALLLIAPSLEHGLSLNLEGNLVSRPYLEMTLAIMEHFGVQHTWTNNVITIAPQVYQATPFTVEADWSAASYYFGICALQKKSKIQLSGLHQESLQGDHKVAELYKILGVNSNWQADGTLTLEQADSDRTILDYDFIEQPDIAQTVAVSCAGMGMKGLFTGLQTLRIKETNRIAALQTELQKVAVFLTEMPLRFSPKKGQQYYMLEGKANTSVVPSFATYKDHRMAMAFAPLATLFDIMIEKHEVVSKSYPDFWKDLVSLGFQIEEVA